MPTVPQWIYSQLFFSVPKPTTSYAGKTVLVTGANVGLGKEAARHFVALGASRVILAVRSLDKGAAAKADIEKSTNTDGVVTVAQLDMSSYASVIDFASRLAEEEPRLDVAVLNAAVARGDWELFEKDESTITVNVVSTFLLALLLLPQLKATAQKYNTRPTLTFVASEVHFYAKFVERNPKGSSFFANLSAEPQAFDGMERYNVSKLLEVLGVRAMVERKSAKQIPVTINMMTPGLCHSELAREAGIGLAILKTIFARSTEVGGRLLVHAACSGTQTHGQYLADCQVTLPSAFVLSDEGYEAQNKLWTELEEKLEAIKPGVTKNL